MTEEPQEPEHGIDDLLTKLRARVAERRESGQYPSDLEERLEEHFRRIVYHRSKPDVAQLHSDVDALDSHMDFSPRAVAFDSQLPGGERIHKAINSAVTRHTQDMRDQLQEFAEAIRRATRTLSSAVQNPNSHVHGDLIGHLDAVLERLDTYERAPVDPNLQVADLRRRVEELERAEQKRDFRPWFTNDAFEEHFRDTKESVDCAYEELAEHIWGWSPVLDIGCGHGEFLELLKKRGTECRGVELDAALAETARAKGLNVVAGDGLAVLAAQDDGSLGGISMIQVIEHLSIQQQLDFVALAFDKLRDGGRIVIETVNPQSLYVYAHSFYLDPTHTRPVHPAYLAFLFEQAGFIEVKWEWRNEPPEGDKLELQGDETQKRNIERLNNLLFAPGDYALIITKAPLPS